MKTILKVAALMLIITGLNACRTNKLTSRQEEYRAISEKADSRNIAQKNTYFSRSATATDSSGQDYQVTIFPADTFQFSMESGFKGKARKVEVRGSITRVARADDSTRLLASQARSKKEKLIRKIEEDQLKRSGSVERKSFEWAYPGMVLMLVTVGGMICRRLWKRSPEGREAS